MRTACTPDHPLGKHTGPVPIRTKQIVQKTQVEPAGLGDIPERRAFEEFRAVCVIEGEVEGHPVAIHVLLEQGVELAQALEDDGVVETPRFEDGTINLQELFRRVCKDEADEVMSASMSMISIRDRIRELPHELADVDHAVRKPRHPPGDDFLYDRE